MNYKKNEAKAYAKEHMRGIWAANLTPFDDALRFDEKAYRENLLHWLNDLHLGGIFIAGKQAEFFSMSIAERKKMMAISVDVARELGDRNGVGHAGIITSCSDTNLDVVLDLARYSEQIGADYVIVHSPVLHFGAHTDETIYEYYRYLSEQLDIGIAMWNHPDCGYVMSAQLCSKIAKLPNMVAIKYSTDRELYKELTELSGSEIQISNPDEHDWLQNIEELHWSLYLCSTPPFLLQSKVDQRMNEYTRLAFKGDFAAAKKVNDSLDPVREAFKSSKPKGKPQAHAKYWQELLGQHGGPVRRPLLQLTPEEKETIQSAFKQSGLKT
ncbi:MAG: dihydrodipicolinate synthase family protein [Betaproteobacteria bacterium]|jgi:4-hydroxy-tetrahydrodipicolinate synthase